MTLCIPVVSNELAIRILERLCFTLLQKDYVGFVPTGDAWPRL